MVKTKDLPDGICSLMGKHDGPIVVLLAKTHGDELAGGVVVETVLASLPDIERGKLYIGVGNPLAAKENKRFIDTDLNRSYGKSPPKGHEGARANVLKPLLEHADYLFDIHSFRKPAPPIVCYPGEDFSTLEQLAIHLPIETIVYGPGLWPADGDHIYADTFVCAKGGFGITVESGYLHDTTAVQSVVDGLHGILQLLLGTSGASVPCPVTHPKTYFRAVENIVAAKGFTFSKDWQNFETVPVGTCYATAEKEKYIAKRDMCMLFPKASASIVEGNEACILMEKQFQK